MNLLAIETATNACSVALAVGDRSWRRHELAPRQHAERVLPMIEELLAEAGIELNQLDALAYGDGPGSFIGVRTASSVVQGLALVHDLPVIAVSTLKILAASMRNQAGQQPIVAAWDARMQQVYYAIYQFDGEGGLQMLQAPQVSAPELMQLPAQLFVAVGNAWQVYQSQLQLGEHVTSLLDSERYPDADTLLWLAKQALARGEAITVRQMGSSYLRHPVTG